MDDRIEILDRSDNTYYGAIIIAVKEVLAAPAPGHLHLQRPHEVAAEPVDFRRQRGCALRDHRGERGGVSCRRVLHVRSAPGPELAGPPDCAAANRLAAAAKAAVHSYDMMSELFGCRRLQVCALLRILPPFSTLVLYLPL